MDRKCTILHLVDSGFKRNRTGHCVVGKVDGEWKATTVEEFGRCVEHLALGFTELGIKKGQTVALHSENRPEWFLMDQALLSLGAVTVPIYTTQPDDQIEYILKNSEAQLYIVSNDELYSSIKPVWKNIPTLKGVFSFSHSTDSDVKHYSEIEKLGEKRQVDHPDEFATLKAKVEPDDLATLIYTSGTTGTPKGVMLTHWCVASNVVASEERVPFNPADFDEPYSLSFLPLAHIFERMISYLYTYMGMTIHFVGNIDDILVDFQSVRPIVFTTVPRVLEKIHAGFRAKVADMTGLGGLLAKAAIEHAENYDVAKPYTGIDALKMKLFDVLVYKKFRAAMGGRILNITSGGAALSPLMMNFFNAIGILTGQGYGLTETSPVISVYHKEQLKAGSAGIPLKNVEVKIAEDGEILARGPNIMKGYFKMAEATKEVLDDDGWFHTGDIGHLDDDGFLFITDRKKALFKLSTGKYVGPQHLENLLKDQGQVEQIVVIGNGKKFCAALIYPDYRFIAKRLESAGTTLHEDQKTTQEEVLAEVQSAIDLVNKKVPHWEQIKRFRLLAEPLSIEGGELTPKMSIKRPFVMKKYDYLVKDIYEEL